MAYNKTDWKALPNTSTPIIPDNLNKIEDELEVLDTQTDLVSSEIGDLEDLETSVKTNIVGAVNEVVAMASSAGITESSSNNNGSYIKFSDGTMVCNYTQTINAAINIATGAFYRSDFLNLQDFPQEFISVPTIQVTSTTGHASDGAGWVCNFGVATTKNPGRILLFGHASYSNANPKLIHVTAFGRWKE